MISSTVNEIYAYMIKEDKDYYKDSNPLGLVDSLYNITQKNKKKIMIHCHGGHGRTGTIACCLYGLNFINKNFSTIKEIFKKKEGEAVLEAIENIARYIFKLSQLIITTQLRLFRKTDQECVKGISSVIIPETAAQVKFSTEVLNKYIIRYMMDDKLFTPIANTSSLLWHPSDTIKNFENKTSMMDTKA